MGRTLSFVALLITACGGSVGTDAGGMDAASLEDAGGAIDCSLIGCGAPVACTETCTAPCGCCPCADGQEIEIDGRDHVCSGGCYALRGDLAAGAECTMTSECGPGLSCCYPCGIPDCANICEPTCEEGGGEPCFGGCLLRP